MFQLGRLISIYFHLSSKNFACFDNDSSCTMVHTLVLWFVSFVGDAQYTNSFELLIPSIIQVFEHLELFMCTSSNVCEHEEAQTQNIMFMLRTTTGFTHPITILLALKIIWVVLQHIHW